MLIQHRAPLIKPTGGPVLRVRRDHPLAQELRACIVMGGAAGVGLDLVSGIPLTEGGAPEPAAGEDGQLVDLDNTSYLSLAHDASLNITENFSLGWRGRRNSSTDDIIISKLNYGVGGGGEYTPFDFQITTGASIYFVRSKVGAYNFRAWQGSSSFVPIGRMVSLSITQGAAIETPPRYFVDGVEDATPTSMFGGYATGAALTNNDPIIINGYKGTSNLADASHSLFLIAAATWDTAQNIIFATDPYGVLEDAPLYHFLSGGPTGTTVSLTGIALTSSAGSVEEGIAVAAAGSAATSAAGTPTSAIGSTLAGSAGTASAGTATSAIGMSLTGEALTVSAGSLAYSIGFTLTGSAATSAGGTLTSSGGDTNTERSLTGIRMTALPGNVRVTGGTRWRPSEAQAVTPPSMVGNTLQPPPRLVGDPASDNRAIQQWLQTLYDHVIKRDNVLGRIADHETRIAAIEADDQETTQVVAGNPVVWGP